MAKMERRYSQISARTLQRLDSLETTYDEMAAAVSEIKLALDAGVSREDLLSVKHRLAQLNGDLEKFQFTKIDAVETSELNSGKTDAKAHRKALNQDVEATQRLITELGERVREAEAQADDGTPSAQVPVARETISAALQKVAALRRDGRLDGDQAAATKDLVIRGDARVLAVCATDDDDACVEGLLALI